MSETLRRVQTLVLAGDYLVSEHGFDELAEHGILPSDAIVGVAEAIAVEDYPDRVRGPTVLAPELPSWKYVNALDLRALWGFFR